MIKLELSAEEASLLLLAIQRMDNERDDDVCFEVRERIRKALVADEMEEHAAAMQGVSPQGWEGFEVGLNEDEEG